MKKKQFLGMIVAAILVIVVGIVGTIPNIIEAKYKKEAEEKSKASLGSITSIFSDESLTYPTTPYIAQLDIVGTIMGSDSTTGSGYNHDRFMEMIEHMKTDDLNKGILLYVDSPGGTTYHSNQLYKELLEYKEETGRPIYAYFDSMACSGAYYISMAADEIYANIEDTTGSIGVILSYTNYGKLYEKIGLEEIDITSGRNKTIGSATKPLTKEQEEILQAMVDESYDRFVNAVSNGRKMDVNTVKELADGRIYTATQAKENGLIDEISEFDEYKEHIIEKGEYGPDIEFFEPKDEITDFFTSLFGKIESLVPKSETQIITEKIENPLNGELLYYAK